MNDQPQPRAPLVGAVTATISAGNALSASIDCTNGTIQLIGMPSDWTPAALTFQLSLDNSNFFDLFDLNNNEVSLNAIPNAMVVVNGVPGKNYARLRSGTRSSPVAQQFNRQFSLYIL